MPFEESSFTSHNEYRLHLKASNEVLPEELPDFSESAVFVKNISNDEYLVRIFDRTDYFMDYTNLSVDVKEKITSKFDDPNFLSDQELIDLITVDQGHTLNGSRAWQGIEDTFGDLSAENDRKFFLILDDYKYNRKTPSPGRPPIPETEISEGMFENKLTTFLQAEYINFFMEPHATVQVFNHFNTSIDQSIIEGLRNPTEVQEVIFVINKDGNLVTSTLADLIHGDGITHSILANYTEDMASWTRQQKTDHILNMTRNRPLRTGGEFDLSVDETIFYFDNTSGHYRPDIESLSQGVMEVFSFYEKLKEDIPSLEKVKSSSCPI